MIILKLGGSVITDKAQKQSFKTEIMNNLASQIKKADKEVIIIHGAGSFGHILAKEHNLNDGFFKDSQLLGFSQTHSMVQKLSNLVIDCLNKHNIPAVAIPPHSILTLKDHKPAKMDFDIFSYYIKHGFTPVTFGDVALDESLRFSICSGDLLVELLTKHFKPDKVVFAIDEDGLFSSNPKKDKNAKLIDKANVKDLEKLTTTLDSHADVTGGMAGKINTIKTISKQGIETILVNGNKPDRLYKVLIGEDCTKTVIYGEK
jgi:isopentenyl phosphate kinase